MLSSKLRHRLESKKTSKRIIQIGDKKYEDTISAAKDLGISPSGLRNRLKSKKPFGDKAIRVYYVQT